MSPELLGLITEYRDRLQRHVADHGAFIERLRTHTPDLIEREAAAAMLHSFYTGIEFILRSIADGIDLEKPASGAWHATLLGSMGTANSARPPVLSHDLAASLRTYMRFRHRFRNLYGGELEWPLMRPLVIEMPEIGSRFEAELTRFVADQIGHV